MIDISFQTLDKDKVIACAVHFGEFQFHLHPAVRLSQSRGPLPRRSALAYGLPPLQRGLMGDLLLCT
jgi:hypothetical protein